METVGRSILTLVLLAVLASAVAYGAIDARKRGKSPWLVGLMIFFSFPFGLLVWLVFRPSSVSDANGAAS